MSEKSTGAELTLEDGPETLLSDEERAEYEAGRSTRPRSFGTH